MVVIKKANSEYTVEVSQRRVEEIKNTAEEENKPKIQAIANKTLSERGIRHYEKRPEVIKAYLEGDKKTFMAYALPGLEKEFAALWNELERQKIREKVEGRTKELSVSLMTVEIADYEKRGQTAPQTLILAALQAQEQLTREEKIQAAKETLKAGAEKGIETEYLVKALKTVGFSNAIIERAGQDLGVTIPPELLTRAAIDLLSIQQGASERNIEAGKTVIEAGEAVAAEMESENAERKENSSEFHDKKLAKAIFKKTKFA